MGYVVIRCGLSSLVILTILMTFSVLTARAQWSWQYQQQQRQQLQQQQQRQQQQRQRQYIKIGNYYYDYQKYILYYCSNVYRNYYMYAMKNRPRTTTQAPIPAVNPSCPKVATPPPTQCECTTQPAPPPPPPPPPAPPPPPTTATPTMPPTTSTTTTSTTRPTTPTTVPPAADFRIPSDVYPRHYTLNLHTYIDEGNYRLDGFVRIDLECRSSTDKIHLHMKSIDINEQSLVLDGTNAPAFENLTINTDRNMGIFQFSDFLRESGNYSIEMNFTTNLSQDLTGFYGLHYKDGPNTRIMASTHLAPGYARTIFPCFDEPSIKATFELLTTHSNAEFIRFSSGEYLHNAQRAHGIDTVFGRTPPMSTYQLGVSQFIVSVQTGITAVGRGVVLGARLTVTHATEQGFNTAKLLLPILQDYFKVDYPLSIFVAVLSPSAVVDVTDSWGMVTFRESTVLYDVGISTLSNFKSTAIVLAQGLSHQWIGGLVTPSCWNDWWLQKGFTSYMGYVASDLLDPTLDMISQFVLDILHTAFLKDDLVSSPPLYVPELRPEDFNSLFGLLSQTKGASLMRMMNFFLGDDIFREGLKIYLTDFKFKAADHNDLWASMQKAALVDGNAPNITNVMESWISQTNFPVINVKVVTDGLMFTQERFILNSRSNDSGTPSDYRWDIPITYTHSNANYFNQSKDDVIWFPRENDNLHVRTSLPDPALAGSWIVVNVHQYGYYRVNYEDRYWHFLELQLYTDHTVIDKINRAQIISDVWHLARAGLINTMRAVRFMPYLFFEKEYIPWSAACKEIDFMDRMFSKHGEYPQFQMWLRGIIGAPFAEIGQNGNITTHDESLMNALINKYACLYDIYECISWALQLFEHWRMHTPIPAIWRETVYCTAVKAGHGEEWDLLYHQLEKETFEQEANRILKALLCTRKIWLIERLLQFTLVTQHTFVLTRQQVIEVIVGAAQNPSGACAAWDFFTTNIKQIERRVGAVPFAMETMIDALTSSFNTEVDLTKLENFRKSSSFSKNVAVALDRASERAKTTSKWFQMNRVEMINYFGYSK